MSTDLKCELDQDGGLVNNLTQNHFLSIEIFELLQVKPHPKHLDESFLSDLYLKNGLSLRQISDRLGCSRKAVRKQLVALGIMGEQLSNSNVSKNLLKTILKMRSLRFSYRRIAEYLNSKKIKTRSGNGKWHSKTIREIVLSKRSI